MPTQLSDVVVPQEFTAYQIQESMVRTALFKSGVLVRNGQMATMLEAGGEAFVVPFWNDLPDVEADITNDDPADFSTPQKVTADKQIVRKSYLHESWSAMSLASELAGSDPLVALRNRVNAYWDRQWQKRLIASLQGVIADNVANDGSDMVHDVSTLTGDAAKFSAEAVIDAAGTLGDRLEDVKAIAMHSAIYGVALKNDLIQFIPQSEGGYITTFRGLAVTIDDGLSPNAGVYTTILFGAGALGFGVAAPRMAPGTELYRLPHAGKGAGQDTLHSRFNVAIHPLGFQWVEGTIASESPSIAELAVAAHWNRVVVRKAVPLAFLLSK